jgi:CRISPR-associated exonuclease Cas4
MPNPPGADYLPISALQHLLFCERQCALIHLERVWAENELTAQGRVLHERAHHQEIETRPGVRVTRSLQLVSRQLGLYGVADVVEFPKDQPPLPIEYKRGSPKKDLTDAVQLCAQVLCLEEMLQVSIPEGCFFYGTQRRRFAVAMDSPIRRRTETAVGRLRSMIQGRVTPPAKEQPKCRRCSLFELCMPHSLRFAKGAAAYNDRHFQQLIEEEPEP